MFCEGNQRKENKACDSTTIAMFLIGNSVGLQIISVKTPKESEFSSNDNISQRETKHISAHHNILTKSEIFKERKREEWNSEKCHSSKKNVCNFQKEASYPLHKGVQVWTHTKN